MRNASLTFPSGCYHSSSSNSGGFSSLNDEKKSNDASSGGEGGLDAPPNNNNNMQNCRVEASLHGFGLPLQAAPISTRYAPLVLYNDNYPLHHGGFNGSNMVSHVDYSCGVEWATASFDTFVSLPVRWRDLTRDACLTLNVFSDGHNSDDIGGREDSPRVWGTTLPLFDEHGRLRTGLYKLKLYPDVLADGGMSYQSTGILQKPSSGEPTSNDCIPIETFLEGGATPGVSNEQSRFRDCHSSWLDERKLNNEEDDPKWKASLILHELGLLESQTATANATAGDASSKGGSSSDLPRQGGQSTSSVPWLDALTRKRCLDVLNEKDEEEDIMYSDVNPNARTTRNQSNGSPSPTSSHHQTPYLIIELPTPPIPVLHEEPLYPVETSSHLRGTTGSITASELMKFHSKFRSEDDATNNSGAGGMSVRISPSAIELPPISADMNNPSLPLAQTFLYPLVQTLDYEPPLTDENETPQDNPAQDKYRILAHDLIRGLVDPGLKPDRVQRSRLERIVGSPSYHLSTEEKDLLWRFRFSLVDNRRALTKFLLAVDWSVESEVVQAQALLEQWRKRSPIEVTDALKLLGRNVAFQTSLVSRNFLLRLIPEGSSL